MTTHPAISFQGALGAYSHLACARACPDHAPLPCPDFETAIAAVQNGAADLGMLPIDNTIAGRVADIHHLLPKSGLRIVGEFFLPIAHCLLGVRGATLADIKTVTSHIHALPQCRDIIAKHGWRRVVTSDTAVAAAEVAQSGDMSVVAIASELAGETYGLDILARDIADHGGNTTRFVILARPDHARSAVGEPTGRDMTSLVFRVRSVPAALYKALGGFATNGVNLTKLESYFVDGGFAAAEFYCEIEGHPAESAMIRALDELNHFAAAVDIVGVYAQDASRFL